MTLIALYVRSFVYTVIMFLSFIILCSVAILPSPLISEKRRWEVAVLWSEVNIIALKIICGLSYVVKGEEKVWSHGVFMGVYLFEMLTLCSPKFQGRYYRFPSFVTWVPLLLQGFQPIF